MRAFLTILALLASWLPCPAPIIMRPIAAGGADPLASIKTDLFAFFDFNDATDAHGTADWTEAGTPDYTGGYITIVAGSAELDGGTGAGTLADDWAQPANVDADATAAFWFEANGSTVNGEDLVRGHNGAFIVEWITPTVGFRGRINSLTNDNANSGTPSTGTWYFIVVVRDAAGDTNEVYVDDASDGSTAGTFTSGGVEFDVVGDGRYAWMGFWNRKLTTAEISALFAEGVDLAYADLP